MVTTTVAVPAPPAGVVPTRRVAETNVTPVAAAPPNVAPAPAWKPVPVIVTVVPPAVGPIAGLTDVTVGGAR